MSDLIDRAVAWVKSPIYIDMTTRQLAILGLVMSEREPMRVHELATSLNVAKAVVTRAVTVLQDHGFVERRRGLDRRDCFIAPTPAAWAFRTQIGEAA